MELYCHLFPIIFIFPLLGSKGP